VAGAIEPYEFETDAELRQFQGLIEELRCPKCQNENLANSSSQISTGMRSIIAEKVTAGETDKQIKDFLVERYTDYILYKTPLDENTWWLWATPYTLFGIGLVCFALIVYRRSKNPEDGIDEEDH
jgi:cytochrome c-type biogenesis protein CcmH